MTIFFLLCSLGAARLKLSTELKSGNLPGSATVRHWYWCTGLSSDTVTAEEQLAGIKVAQDLRCSREFTFKQLCCADFTQATKYVEVGGEGPYYGARHITMASDSAQQTGAYSLINDAAGLASDTQTLRLCTTQYATASIAASGGSGPVMVGGQQCLNEEFLPQDLANGELLLDKRILFLEKQGLPGTSIPVCHKQFPQGETCPPESARMKNGKTGFNSASAATLKRIGQPLPGQALVRIEDELDALPENQPLSPAEENSTLGLIREHRSQVKTLRGLASMQPAAVASLLDGDLDVALSGKVLRLKVENVTGGEQLDIRGSVEGREAELTVSKTAATLVGLGEEAEALSPEDVVLSTIGKFNQDNMFGDGEYSEGGDYYYGDLCGIEGYYFECEDPACGEPMYYFPCHCGQQYRDDPASCPEPMPPTTPTMAPPPTTPAPAEAIVATPALIGPGELKTKRDDKCMDYNYNNQNVYMHPCHNGANQIFYINEDNGEMKTQYNDKCLDYNYNNGNVYMHPCHGGANQQWYIDPNHANRLRTRYNDHCLDYDVGKSNVIMWHDCHGNTNQQWFFNAIPLARKGPGLLKTHHDAKCMDYNYNNNNVYMHPCHNGANQIFSIASNGEMKTNYDDKCLDYNYGNNNVYMHPCHGGKNQRFTIKPDGHMQTAWDNKCLDYNYNNGNVYMHPCHGGGNQKWFFEAPR